MLQPGLPAGIRDLAIWSSWVPFDDALSTAPREPGVYLARIGAEEHIVYVGLAGERSGNGKRQAASSRHPGSAQAIRDGTGRGVTSGLGEAVSDRAFADAAFVSERLAEIEQGEPKRAVEWGRAALAWADLHICWATTPDKASAEVLEARCGAALSSSGIWNRGAFRKLVE